MEFRVLLLVFFAFQFVLPQKGLARTLIVTHPEKSFDKESSAGIASRRLLQGQEFDRKILLLTPPANTSDLTFSIENLNYDLVRSPDGTLTGVNDREIVLAGGYAGACMFGSLLSIVQATKSDLHFSLPMAAIYAMKLSFIHGATDPEATDNLLNWQRILGDKLLNDFLKDYGTYTLEKIPFDHGYETPSGRNASEYQIFVQLNGKTVSTHGEGIQKIYINFTHSAN